MKTEGNNIKLGIFVMCGLAILVITLYLVGENKNNWGSGIEVKIQFSDLDGLVEGDNVLYAGMAAGSVKKIQILKDTTIEVTLLVNNKTGHFIKRNSVATIGSEGLMGNKVINISPVAGNADLIKDGDYLASRQPIGIEQMLPKLSRIGDNVELVSGVLKNTVLALDSSQLMKLMKDSNTAKQLRSSLTNAQLTIQNTAEMTAVFRNLAYQTKNGKGALGLLVADSGFAHVVSKTMNQIADASHNVNEASLKLNNTASNINDEILHGKGMLNLLLTDSASAGNISKSLLNIKNGTDGFNQNMEALKHNFLFRGYFRKQQKEEAKQLNKTGAQ
ncbi:MlaD family protein [Mucilaginibacter angelicae]|uniref:MlaD family protein n=1 Tax=Mucilaginibacter angelicae TaxID=869718 RepID=A0ABV6KZN9_9SPHI